MRGRWISLSRPRRLMVDYVHFAKGIPIVAVETRWQLGPLLAARKTCAERPSFIALFMRAYALAASDFPEFRRAYVRLPWPHLYEHYESVAAFTIEREWRGEKGVFQVPVKRAADRSLAELQRIVRHAQTAPIGEVKPVRRALDFAALPWPLRRAFMWLALNSGWLRARHIGTFAVTTISSLGAWSLHTLSPMPGMLTFGPIGDDGSVTMRFFWDHRIMDGVVVAHALARMEQLLVTDIAEEVQTARAH